MDFGLSSKTILKYLALIYFQGYIYNIFKTYMPSYNEEEYIYI